MIKPNSNLPYPKKFLIDRIKEIVDEKKKRLGTETLFFEKEEVSNLDGVSRVGFYAHRRNEFGHTNFVYWDEISAITLVKIRDCLLKNRFYAEKRIEGTPMKVRLKRNQKKA